MAKTQNFSSSAEITILYLQCDKKQAMKNTKTYLKKIFGFIAKAFDAFYNFLDLIIRIGMAACILALKLIIHLLRPATVKVVEWLRALFVRHPKYRGIVEFNHVKRIRRLEDETYSLFEELICKRYLPTKQ